MIVKTYSAALTGLEVSFVNVEAFCTAGMHYHLTGLGDTAVKESHDRIFAALSSIGKSPKIAEYTINLAPADLKKEGSGYDLPVAVALLALNGHIKKDNIRDFMFLGELSLDGTIHPIKGALPIAIEARKNLLKNITTEGIITESGTTESGTTEGKTTKSGTTEGGTTEVRKGVIKGLILPKENEREAAAVNNLPIYGVSHISEVIDFFNGNPRHLSPTIIDTRKEFQEENTVFDIDFADVKGQEVVKRAMEVAAAGGHNMILVGPPGSGKSMMAKRLPTILPPLTLHESLETTQIFSIAGMLGSTNGKKSPLMTRRPFRSPHHTISQVALCGGGTIARPGEISLAHNGILFADELPEFNKKTLEVLRQPLEDHKVSISRATYNIDYPCNFMFVAAMNPCPCGYYNDPTHDCNCTPGQIKRYIGKISGPLLDRIDLQIECTNVKFNDLAQMQPGEPSRSIRERVVAAREIQTRRFAKDKGIYCNAQMNEKHLHKYAEPSAEAMGILKDAMERFNLSARAYSRILKVARTIADLDNSETVEKRHIQEAVLYRSLDRSYWGEW